MAELLTEQQRNNFKHLYADIFWWGILGGSTLSFAGIFATRAGATSFHLGLLSAGPALINLFFSLPAGRWLESRPVVRVTFLSALWNRVGFIPFVLLPLIASQVLQVWGLIAITLVMTVPAVIIGIAFNASFADLVPPEQRAHVVGRRNALVALSLTITAMLSGLILDKFPYPANYMSVFGLGLVGAVVSTYHLGRLKAGSQIPERVGQPLLELAKPGLFRSLSAGLRRGQARFLTRRSLRGLLRPDLLRGKYGKFLMAYLAFYICQYLPVPLFPIFFVDELMLSDGLISLGTALFHLAMLLSSIFLEKMTHRWGYYRLVLLAAAGYAIYPLLNGATSQVEIYLLASLLGGVFWGILGGSMVNLLMAWVPANDRPAHMALHNLALNIGVLAGSFLGPVLSGWIGLRPGLLLIGVLRLVVVVLLARWTRLEHVLG